MMWIGLNTYAHFAKRSENKPSYKTSAFKNYTKVTVFLLHMKSSFDRLCWNI